jgi:hypothetical protein
LTAENPDHACKPSDISDGVETKKTRGVAIGAITLEAKKIRILTHPRIRVVAASNAAHKRFSLNPPQ